MPMTPVMPPSSRTICPNAAPSSLHVMSRPVLNESIGEKFFARLITSNIALEHGNQNHVRRRMSRVPFSSLPTPTEPLATVSASVPLDKTTARTAMEKNAATGNDRKLAAISPIAASSAIQQKMMPSPRAKFSANPPFGYSTSMPSATGELSSDVAVERSGT